MPYPYAPKPGPPVGAAALGVFPHSHSASIGLLPLEGLATALPWLRRQCNGRDDK